MKKQKTVAFPVKASPELVGRFRQRVVDLIKPEHDDHFLAKWLRARDLDVDKAEEMFRTNQKWRATIGVDGMLTSYDPPEVLMKHFPGGFVGQDRRGNPVWIEPFGRADVRGLMKCSTVNEVILYKVWQLEKMIQWMRQQELEAGDRLDGFTMIYDMAGFGKHFVCPAMVQVLIKLCHVFQAHFPESLNVIIIINVSALFPSAYSIFKPFIHDETKRKILIFGERGWKEALMARIAPEELPKCYGGTKTGKDGDEMCKDSINYGGKVDSKHFSKKV